jgi:hypothetical protein
MPSVTRRSGWLRAGLAFVWVAVVGVATLVVFAIYLAAIG